MAMGMSLAEAEAYTQPIRAANPREAIMMIMRDSKFIKLFYPSTSSGAGDLIESYLDDYRDQVLTEVKRGEA